jgi:hypothetical protein
VSEPLILRLKIRDFLVENLGCRRIAHIVALDVILRGIDVRCRNALLLDP